MILRFLFIKIVIIKLLLGACNGFLNIITSIIGRRNAQHPKSLSYILPTQMSSQIVDNSLYDIDKDINNLIISEWDRQYDGINLIASENYASNAVLEALGSCMTNKYSEGLPYKRYYGGAQFVDKLEDLCGSRALELFGCDSSEWGVNVQPYSGSPANFAVYTALLSPQDRIMGLDLPSGGHLTHGYQTIKRKVSATSIYFESKPYHVDPVSGLIDYDGLYKLANEFKPKMIIAGASAYSRDWDYARMKEIADSVGAYLMADIAHISGLVVAKECNSPFEYCHVVTTTTHKTLRGPRSGMIFSRKTFRQIGSSGDNATAHVVDLTEFINRAVFPGLQGGPHNNQIAAVAVALKEASSDTFKDYIRQVKANAHHLSTSLQKKGYVICTGGTDNHMLLWDCRSLNISGLEVEKILERIDISVNKNTIIGDTSAITPGGVRLGTPGMTTRGMAEKDMEMITDFIHEAINIVKNQSFIHPLLYHSFTAKNKKAYSLDAFVNALENEPVAHLLDSLKERVTFFARSFPLPGKDPRTNR